MLLTMFGLLSSASGEAAGLSTGSSAASPKETASGTLARGAAVQCWETVLEALAKLRNIAMVRLPLRKGGPNLRTLTTPKDAQELNQSYI
mmetsp:Transcript_1096/g.2394  ORF Transcript_1096/g.2394 Transcript_1096/m.2394 type:complete len:90 (+) Transcript_1096:345-614(+)